jgi:hypothetical protein
MVVASAGTEGAKDIAELAIPGSSEGAVAGAGILVAAIDEVPEPNERPPPG